MHQILLPKRCSPSSAFPHTTISHDYLAMNDHAEVCPLSCRAMSQPVSFPLQKGIRFLRTPLPTGPTVFLAVHLPLPAVRWAYPVPHEFQDGADPSYSTGGIMSMRAHVAKTLPAAYLLVQACQHIWLVLCDDALTDVHICWSYPSVPCVSPPLCWQVSLNLTASLPVTRRLRCSRSFTPNRCQFRMSG